MRTDLREFPACPIGRELTESECQEAAGELEVGKFDGVWNRDGAENLPCGCFLWKYSTYNYNMVLYRNVQQAVGGCGAKPNNNLGMICKKVRLCFVIAVNLNAQVILMQLIQNCFSNSCQGNIDC